MKHVAAILGLLAAVTAPAAARPPRPTFPRPASVNCSIVLDGRVPAGTKLTDFDAAETSIFNPDYVKGNNLTWSQILRLPGCGPSRFSDGGRTVPVEVTIDDRSVFMAQTGFRRAGLQFSEDSPADPSDEGVKTIHFSVKLDSARPFNLSHEYLVSRWLLLSQLGVSNTPFRRRDPTLTRSRQLLWHETADYSANQFNFQTGTIIGTDGASRDTYKVTGRAGAVVATVARSADAWQNFAVTIDHAADTLRVYHSDGPSPLRPVSAAVPNDNSGGGQFQFGVLKKPTGTDDVVNGGYQSPGLDEGLIYGGVFVEDSAGGCVSL